MSFPVTDIFGKDDLEYECDKFTKVNEIAADSLPTFTYEHEEW